MAVSDFTPIGARFGKLAVISAPFKNKYGIARVTVRCDCGTPRDVNCADLRDGKTASCGCARSELGESIIEKANREGEYRGVPFGTRFGRLILVGLVRKPAKQAMLAAYTCDCGSRTVKHFPLVRSGHTTSCGCAAPANNTLEVVAGEKLGRLTVIRTTQNHSEKGTAVDAICECGKVGSYLLSAMRSGRIKSCGCAIADKGKHFITHGHTRQRKPSPTYLAYRNTLTRCTNPKSDHWHSYGGRGIAVCARWLESFENFLADMGECPSGLTLDREEVDGNYEPGNCRWATDDEQANNKRTSHFVEFNGERLTVTQWANRLNIPANTIYSRLKKQRWSVEKTLTTPTGIGRNQFS
jgi:hypothetical protein